MKRISLIGPVYPYRGGIAAYTGALARALAEDGPVQTISYKRQYPSWLYPGQTDKDPSGMFNAVEAHFLLDSLDPRTWGRVVQQVLTFQTDFAIMQWWTTFWAPANFFIARALRRAGVPLVYCIHNVMPHEQRFFDRFLARQVLANADALITLSPKETKRLNKLLPDARVYPSRLPVTTLPKPIMSREAIRSELGVPPDALTLLFFGFVRHYKGLGVLIDALGLLREQGLRPFLLIAGEFWEDEQIYRRQIEHLGLQNQVRIENRYIHNEEIGRFYAAADGLVAPHLEGTQSGTIKMALGSGLPLLASDRITSDVPEGEFSVLRHTAGNAKELAESIRALADGKCVNTAGKPTDDWPDIRALVRQVGEDICRG